MNKAKYIGKSYDKDYIYLEYQYKGYTYEVYQHKSKGSEPLQWQHKNAQRKIDQIIENKAKCYENEAAETVQKSLDYFFDYLENN